MEGECPGWWSEEHNLCASPEECWMDNCRFCIHITGYDEDPLTVVSRSHCIECEDGLYDNE